MPGIAISSVSILRSNIAYLEVQLEKITVAIVKIEKINLDIKILFRK
ncbi:hypothetical protein ADICYQ_2773 [Cyclobacterium qasimii M12-11B]|uniref:Uncharacterized protein n=1 Tax=Cyclobacterium qasimii M12-11B TaxID=641524 RepID=S7WWB7_9BACT|nr:hypothetical protein ADICYQ_2773 [Cyclobacterium qasimii M12-11B]